MTSCISFLCNDIFTLCTSIYFTLSHSANSRPFISFSCFFSVSRFFDTNMMLLCSLIAVIHSRQSFATIKYQAASPPREKQRKQWKTSKAVNMWMNACICWACVFEVRWCVKVRYFYELSKHVCCSLILFSFLMSKEKHEPNAECWAQEVRHVCDYASLSLCLYLG